MDKGTLGARNEIAQGRMIAAATRLAEMFDLAPETALALAVREKDPLVRAMKQRETVADLLEAIVKRGEVIQSLAVAPVQEEVVLVTTITTNPEPAPVPEQEPEPKQEQPAAPVKRGKGK